MRVISLPQLGHSRGKGPGPLGNAVEWPPGSAGERPAPASSPGPAIGDDAEVHVELLERCRAGDTRAWEEFFRRWTPPVFRWAILLGLTASEAEDAVQDVLTVVMRRLENGMDVAWVKEWLFQITRRVTANHRRRKRLWGSFLPVQEMEPAFEPRRGRPVELELAVRECLTRLPPLQAEVLLLVEIEGFTREEAARAIDLPAGTVASRLRLAKAAFQRLWNARTPDRSAALSWESP